MTTLSEALVKGQGVERSFNCPVHDDRRASASVNVVKGLWVCYACGAAGSVDDVPPPNVDQLVAASFTTVLYDQPDEWLDLFDAHHTSPYWSARFDHATSLRFRCGTHPLTGEPTYPMFSSSVGYPVAGVVVRTKDGQPKYRYPSGAHTSQTLFNIRALTRPRRFRAVVLCEGATDVMAVYHAWPTIEDDADAVVLGVYGSGVHEPQRRIITEMVHPAFVVTAFDLDDAGRLATAAAQAMFSPTKVVSAPIPSLRGAVKDLADMEPPHRKRIIERALAQGDR